MENIFSDEYFMNEAIKEARKAYGNDEIPIGVVIVEGNKIIGRAFNQVQMLNDSTAHAEMIALTSAFAYRKNKYLSDCTLYVTLEPCLMCAYAIHLAHVKKLVYAANDTTKGFTLLKKNILHPKTEVIQGILAEDSENLLKNFFMKLRN